MGEQSNAYRILLRYDRKSRHRRIKKQRRYERLAATSQFVNPNALNGRGQLVPKTPERSASLRAFGRRPVAGRPRIAKRGIPGTRCNAGDTPQLVKGTTGMSIPVVTFLAPLASNFEGLKDR